MKTSLSLALVDACRLAGNLAFSIENALTLTVSARHGPEVAEDPQSSHLFGALAPLF